MDPLESVSARLRIRHLEAQIALCDLRLDWCARKLRDENVSEEEQRAIQAEMDFLGKDRRDLLRMLESQEPQEPLGT